MNKCVNLIILPENIPLGKNGLLKHQEETIDALKRNPIVMNQAMTGAGKTKAAHLGVKEFSSRSSVLYVAPTNALVSQNLLDAKKFVKENDLPHQVVAVDGSVLSSLQRKYGAYHRPSAVLHQIIENPRAFGEELGIGDEKGPLWLITNPDQIWLSIVKGRGQDTRNLLIDFVNRFRFIVVDEFHYYGAEQLILFFLCVAFWKHFGQFDAGLKMLLLTATPDRLVWDFFYRMGFSPDIVGNTVSEEGGLPVLAPVNLTLTIGKINDFSNFVLKKYHDGKDGVIISDSLLEINKEYCFYKNLKIMAGRITGPINNYRRMKESKNRLILATPTVDLGYNFIKSFPKQRQEIDFLLCSVRNKSSFWQRLGRAGRVLGRKETNIPSQAVMLMPNSICYLRTHQFEGKSISRSKLNELIDLGDKRLKSYALIREGLFTATHQLNEIENILPEQQKKIVVSVFDTLKECLDASGLTSDWNTFRKRHWLSKQFRDIGKKYGTLTTYQINAWVKNRSRENINDGIYKDPIEILLGSWAKNHFYEKGQLENYNQFVAQAGITPLLLALFRKNPKLKKNVIQYYKNQTLRLNYLFNFRGGAWENQVWIYDPEQLFSAHDINRIDLSILLSKYCFYGPITHTDAEKNWKIRLPKSDMFFKITDFQQYPFPPVFEYHGVLPKRPQKTDYNDDKEFDLVPCFWQTIALHELNLNFKNAKLGYLPIPLGIKPKLTGLSELFFITPMENRFILDYWLKEYEVRTGTLESETFAGATKRHGVVFGKDAILISEELYYRIQEKNANRASDLYED